MTVPVRSPIKSDHKIKIPDPTPPFFLRVIVTALLMFLLFGISIAISLYGKGLNVKPPTNFEECSSTKGSIIQESYPEICVTRKGSRFVREIGEEEKKLLDVPVEGNPEKQFCGGIAALPCPEGYACQLDGDYPDAGGICITN